MVVVVFGAFAVITVVPMVVLPFVPWLLSRRQASESSSKKLRAALILYTICGEAALFGPLSLAVNEALRAAGIVLSDVDPSLTHIWAASLIVATGVGLTSLIVAATIDPRWRRARRLGAGL